MERCRHFGEVASMKERGNFLMKSFGDNFTSNSYAKNCNNYANTYIISIERRLI